MTTKRTAAIQNLSELDDPSEQTSVRISRSALLGSEPPPELAANFEGNESVAPSAGASPSEAPDTSPTDIDGAGDSMLSRYFRDMATHQVMGRTRSSRRRRPWSAPRSITGSRCLAYLPVARHARPARARHPDDERGGAPGPLRRSPSCASCSRSIASQRSKLHADQLRRWTELCEELDARGPPAGLRPDLDGQRATA